MTCLTPDLSSLRNQTNVDWPLSGSVSFVMDAVGGLATGQTPTVRYFADPIVYHFDDRVRNFYDDDTYLEIKVVRCLLICVRDELATLTDVIAFFHPFLVIVFGELC